MNKIIDNVEDLMLLSNEELNEKLVDEKYNKANLRELVRRTLKKASEYKDAFEHQRELNTKLENKLEDVKKIINKDDNLQHL